MNTCPECNRFLGDAGHASTCSKRGLPPVRVEDDVVPVPEALAVRLLELMSIIADSRRGSFGWFSGYCPQLECKSIDVLLQEMRKLMDRHNAPAHVRAEASNVEQIIGGSCTEGTR